MHKIILLSNLTISLLFAQNLGKINVIEHLNIIEMNNINGDEVKSFDLGTALSNKDSDIVIPIDN